VKLSENAVKRIYQQVDMLEKSLRCLVPEECDINVSLMANGGVCIDMIHWDRHEGGDYSGVRRRCLLDSLRDEEGNWHADLADDNNRSYRLKGILLEDEMKGEKESA